MSHVKNVAFFGVKDAEKILQMWKKIDVDKKMCDECRRKEQRLYDRYSRKHGDLQFLYVETA